MKNPRRGLRIALAAGAIVLGVIAGAVVLNWSVVRDHLEAWQFSRQGNTVSVQPDPAILERSRYPGGHGYLACGARDLVAMLAASSGRPVLASRAGLERRFLLGLKDATAGLALGALESAGYRVLEQRFPRAAYVVIGNPPDPAGRRPAGAP
jgi:hypothetical protein